MIEWKQPIIYTSVLDVVCAKSGMSEEELINPSPTPPEDIENLVEAASLIKKAMRNNEKINIMGDYDVDGITSTSILYEIFQKLGYQNLYIRFPRRMSEGYGLKPQTINEFEEGLLITIDNGIAANEAVQIAKEKGLTVIIIDHHLPQKELPIADVIVDPHIYPENNGYVDYCGAGLAYKLAQLLVDDELFLESMRTLAAIGTIADNVALTGDNRYIVSKGLQSMRNGSFSLPGLEALINISEISHITEDDIGFKIGPMLNAGGRLIDDGAMLGFKTLTETDKNQAIALTYELLELNDKRKEMTAEAENYVEEIIQQEGLMFDKPLCIFAEKVPEGIAGIITGRIAERYKTPAIIFTPSSNPNIYKGSGRSYGDYNLMTVIDNARPFLCGGGGHAGAAGLSVKKEDYIQMVNNMQETMADYEPPVVNEIQYDIAIKSSELSQYYQEVQKYAPYGQGNPKPVFRIDDIILSPGIKGVAKYMGKTGEHVKLSSMNFSTICFNLANDYKALGQPINIDVLGFLSLNVFRNQMELQVEGIALKEHIHAIDKPSSLLEALRLNGAI